MKEAPAAERPPGRPTSRQWAGFVLLAAALLPASRPCFAADQMLLLEVFLNGADTNQIVRFEDRDGALYASPGDLAQIGLKVPGGLRPGPNGMVPLAGLPGVQAELHFAAQSVAIEAGPSALGTTVIEAVPTPPAVQGEVTPGVLLDYDLLGTLAGPETSASGLFDFRAFDQIGVLESTGVAYAHYGPGVPDFVRLDTNFTHDDPVDLRRAIAGDFVSGALTWTRAVRMGGLQVATDFALRPDLVTFPVPVLSGQAAVPSTAQVLVNGVQSFNGSVNAGPFAIRALPVVSGAGDITLVTRNALGQQVTTTLPFYAATTLLRPGLSQYSLEAGAVRRNYGLVSDDYGTGAASGSFRRGITDWLTIEAHAEGTSGAGGGGIGAVIGVGTFGVLNLAVAASAGGSGGALGTVGFQRQGQIFNLAFSLTEATSGYRDIAAVNGTPVPQRLLLASFGASLGRAGSVGIAYADQRAGSTATALPALTVNGVTLPAVAASFQIVTASYTVPLSQRITFYINAFKNFGTDESGGAIAGIAVAFGNRTTASASGGYYSPTGLTGITRLDVSAITPGQFGLHLYDQQGPMQRLAQADYLGTWGQASVGVAEVPGETAGQGELTGALGVLAGGGPFLSRTVPDSFALVSTSPTGGIGVLSENRPEGRTNGQGALAVPDLNGYEPTEIGLSPQDVPADVTTRMMGTTVTPASHVGVLVNFGVKRSHSALLRLVDAAGRDLPVGSEVRLQATGEMAEVGYGGETYLTGLSELNRITVRLPDGRTCRVDFGFKPIPGRQVEIGPLPCR